MRAEIIVDKDNYVISYGIANENCHMENSILVDIDCTEEEFANSFKNYKLVNDELVYDTNKELITNQEEKKHKIRQLRQKECFSVIDRSQLWYNSLTNEQKAELQEWYEAWLIAPDTLVIPTKPDWL